MRPREIYGEIEARFPLDDFDRVTMAGSGLPRWRAALHFHSVSAVKAGLLEKSDGQWHVTEEGQDKSGLPSDDLKRLLRSRYREWRWGGQKVQSVDKSPVNQEEMVLAPAHASVLFEDAKEKARSEIDAHLDSVDPYEFQSLVAALLEAMGYATSVVAARGPDGGTDVLAYLDPIGAQTPHIRVQVKHRDNPASREEVAALRGIIRADREIGLFVSSGGFTKDARREAGMGSVHIGLIDLDRFLELWLQYYDKLKETARAKLRLEPVYFLSPEVE
jgi:restriction system protein